MIIKAITSIPTGGRCIDQNAQLTMKAAKPRFAETARIVSHFIIAGRARITAASQRGSEGRIYMSPEQCRAAREKLNWTRQELAKAADVPLWFIAAFEDGKDTAEFLAGYEVDMRRVFEEVGIGFPFEIANGRIRGADITYSPRDKDETH